MSQDIYPSTETTADYIESKLDLITFALIRLHNMKQHERVKERVMRGIRKFNKAVKYVYPGENPG